MAQTTTQQRTQTPQPPTSKGQVAVIDPPRLMPPDDQQLSVYDVDSQGWRTLVESIFPAAKTATSVMMALDYCKRRKLDVFKHPVHIVPIWNSQAGQNGKGAMVETIWPGINELRTTAIRTGQYAGMDVPTFGPMVENTFKGRIKKFSNGSAFWEEVQATVTFPEWCQITVYRVLGGNRVPFPGPRVFWRETYSRLRNDCEVPNSMWEKRSNGQLEKCAEAAALRRAFPEELGSDYSIDEIGAFTTHTPADVTDEVTVTTAPAAEPKRSDPIYQAEVAKNETPPGTPPRDQAGGEGEAGGTPAAGGEQDAAPGQPAGKPPYDEKASADATQREQLASAGITDVEDENDIPPEHARPGQKLQFYRFAKISEFCDFADTFLEKTNDEGKRQFAEFYEGMLVAMERGKPKAQAAAKDYRAILGQPPREPGLEG